MGRLTADPELKHTANNIAVTSFTLAVERSYARQGEERQTDFLDVVAWRNTAEFVCKYFAKGARMAISGSIQTRVYEDKNGNKRKAVEILANDVSFADSKREASNSSYDSSYGNASAPSRPAAPGNSASYPQQTQMQDYSEADIDDGDLPF